MKFLVSLSAVFLLSFIQRSLGCHSAYHGGGFNPSSETNGIQGGNIPSSEDRLRDKLSGHGLPQDIINCVVNRMERNSRKKRSFPGNLGDFENIAPRSIEEECLRNGELCMNVLACADERNIDIPQLSFLTTVPPTTVPSTTVPPTTTTTPPPPQPPIPIENPGFPGFPIPEVPKFPGFPIPEVPKFPGFPIPEVPKFPGFPLPEVPKLPGFPGGIPRIPECSRKCSSFICSLRCHSKRR